MDFFLYYLYLLAAVFHFKDLEHFWTSSVLVISICFRLEIYKSASADFFALFSVMIMIVIGKIGYINILRQKIILNNYLGFN